MGRRLGVGEGASAAYPEQDDIAPGPLGCELGFSMVGNPETFGCWSIP